MPHDSPHDSQKKLARLLYTKHGKTIQDAAIEAEIEEADLRNWIATEGWNGIRTSLHTSKEHLLGLYYSQLEKIEAKIMSEQAASPKEMDQHQKYTASIKNLEEPPSIATIIEVFDLFIKWLRRKDPAFTKKVILQLDAFIKYRLA